MSCSSCKKKQTPIINLVEKTSPKSKLSIFFGYTLKVFSFLIIFLITIPIIIPLLGFVLFKTIVLNQSLDIYPMILHIGKKIFEDKKEEEEEEEIDLNELNDDDYELIN